MADKYLKDLIAGMASGCSAILASQPIDVVRVRIQTSQGNAGSAIMCARQMLVHEGACSFYKGTVPPMTGVGVLMSIAFSSQQFMRRQLARGGQPLRVTDNMACGAYGGICQAPIANVIELLKVRLQVQGASSQPLNMRQVFMQVWNSGGFYSLSRGLLPLMIRDAVGYGCYFGVCETLLAWAAPQGGTKKDVHPLKVMAIGMFGGVCYWVPVMPFDTVKSRLHADSLAKPAYAGMQDCFMKSIQGGGVQSLYRGLLLTCIYCLPKNAAKLPVFELVSGFLHGRNSTSAK